MTAMRLDQLLAARGLAPSRARARDAILRGHVSVNGEQLQRPGATVEDTANIEIDDPAARFVSRSALKLLAALDHFGFDPAGRVAIDLGASTGGFTQVLLERGAKRVHAVDVGHGQLDPRLAGEPRVHVLEGINARALGPEIIGERAEALVSDVSFISQRLALPPALGLCAPGAFAVVLAKPQFEVGVAGVGKGGIVRDPEAARAAAETLAKWLGSQRGWRVTGLIPAPISGSDGNQEYLIGAVFR
jgi:23S rRNA (cytidine1920-2'-O)/16S rRNA (cytidine1409-2'-O)-methyltransferase